MKTHGEPHRMRYESNGETLTLVVVRRNIGWRVRAHALRPQSCGAAAKNLCDRSDFTQLYTRLTALNARASICA